MYAEDSLINSLEDIHATDQNGLASGYQDPRRAYLDTPLDFNPSIEGELSFSFVRSSSPVRGTIRDSLDIANDIDEALRSPSPVLHLDASGQLENGGLLDSGELLDNDENEPSSVSSTICLDQPLPEKRESDKLPVLSE